MLGSILHRKTLVAFPLFILILTGATVSNSQIGGPSRTKVEFSDDQSVPTIDNCTEFNTYDIEFETEKHEKWIIAILKLLSRTKYFDVKSIVKPFTNNENRLLFLLDTYIDLPPPTAFKLPLF